MSIIRALVATVLTFAAPVSANACDSVLSQGGSELAANGSLLSCIYLRNSCSFALDVRAIVRGRRANHFASTSVAPGDLGQICAGAPGEKVVFSDARRSRSSASASGRDSSATALVLRRGG